MFELDQVKKSDVGQLPLQFQLSEVTLEETQAVYQLVGAAHHISGTSQYGHYTASIHQNGRSIHANDGHISDEGTSFFCSHGAVVYKRIS